MGDELVDVAAHFVDRRVSQQSEHAEVRVAARRHEFGRPPPQHVREMQRAESLLDPRDGGQDLAGERHGIGHRLELAEAVVARATLRLCERLAEVPDQARHFGKSLPE